MSNTPETDAQEKEFLPMNMVRASFSRKLEREGRWARSMLWELYWIAYDFKRSADAYAGGYNDSEDKKRIKLANTALKNFDKKIKKEGERIHRNKNPES